MITVYIQGVSLLNWAKAVGMDGCKQTEMFKEIRRQCQPAIKVHMLSYYLQISKSTSLDHLLDDPVDNPSSHCMQVPAEAWVHNHKWQREQ